MVTLSSARGLAFVILFASACHEEVTDGFRFSCTTDDDCLPGWFCNAAGFCERGAHVAPDATTAPDSVEPDVTSDAGDSPDTPTATDSDMLDADGSDAADTVDDSDVDASDTIAPPPCERLTHAAATPLQVDGTLLAVRDLAFDADGQALVADATGLFALVGTSTVLAPVEGLTSPFSTWSVTPLADGSWLVSGLPAPSPSGSGPLAYRFHLGTSGGDVMAIDISEVDLGSATVIDLLAPPNAFLIFADLLGSVWLVEPALPSGYEVQPVFGDLLGPSKLAFDAERGITYIAHAARGRLTAIDAAGARSGFGAPGTFQPPPVRSCEDLEAGDACLGATGSQGTCQLADTLFCREAPNVPDPRLGVCFGQSTFADCHVRVAGESMEGDCAPSQAGSLFCYLLAYERSQLNVCDTLVRGDGCVYLDEATFGVPPPLDEESDSDQDGILNDLELDYGLDPDDPDFDGDGHLDGHEPGWANDVDGDGLIAAKDTDSDGDDLPDGDDYTTPTSHYGNCLTANEIGRDDLAPEKLVCVDPTAGDPIARPLITGIAVHPCGGLVVSTLNPGDGESHLLLKRPGLPSVSLVDAPLVTALERGGGGRFPATALYAYDLSKRELVSLSFCPGSCPPP